jgi:serine phosphatase RsbU (regulator of sigma subunit)
LRTLTWARAGHTPLIRLPAGAPGERRAEVLVPNGLVLGLKIDNGERFEKLLEERTLLLGTGDVVLLFTDGVTEAMNADGETFGEERLAALVAEHGDLPFEELRERILREIRAFVGNAGLHDDLTLVLLKVDEAAVMAVAS